METGFVCVKVKPDKQREVSDAMASSLIITARQKSDVWSVYATRLVSAITQGACMILWGDVPVHVHRQPVRI